MEDTQLDEGVQLQNIVAIERFLFLEFLKTEKLM